MKDHFLCLSHTWWRPRVYSVCWCPRVTLYQTRSLLLTAHRVWIRAALEWLAFVGEMSVCVTHIGETVLFKLLCGLQLWRRYTTGCRFNFWPHQAVILRVLFFHLQLIDESWRLLDEIILFLSNNLKTVTEYKRIFSVIKNVIANGYYLI